MSDNAPPQPVSTPKPSPAAPRRAAAWRLLRTALALRGTPEQIAGGVALGTFIAFTPTFGAQIAIAAVLAPLFRLSAKGAILAVWITNPLTMPPIYATTYAVGSVFWPGETLTVGQLHHRLVGVADDMTEGDVLSLRAKLIALGKFGVNIFAPLTIGGIIVGGIAGGIAYWVFLRTIRRYRDLRRRLKVRRAAGRRRAGGPAGDAGGAP